MSLVIIGMSAAFAVAGGALGFAGGLITGIGQAFSRMGSSRISLTKYTLTGAFAGAALGAGIGWVADGGLDDYMRQRGEQAVINACLRKMDNGETVALGRNEAGEPVCLTGAAPGPRP